MMGPDTRAQTAKLMPVRAVAVESVRRALAWVRELRRSLAAWAATCAAYYAAAARYQDLSRLANAELRRRGLTRGTLARDVCPRPDPEAER
jgi:hypothetical protein